jgi:outer membrane protein
MSDRSTPPADNPSATSRACLVSLGLLCVVITSCDDPFRRDHRFTADVDRLRTIDSQTFESQSRTPPVTIEEGAAKALRALEEIGPGPPPESITLSLADVRAAALQNNLDLKVEVYNPAMSETRVSEEEAKFESTIFGSMRKGKTDSPTSSGLEGTQSDFLSTETGVRVPLRTGGDVSVSLPTSELETDNPFSLLNPSYTTDLKFSISQPLLRNAWGRANNYSIRVARQESSIAQSRSKLEAIRILANADKAYWRLDAAQRELDVRLKEHQLAVAQLDRARRMAQAGDVADIEITRAESGVASRLEAIIIAATTVKNRLRDLKRIIHMPGVPMDSPTTIIPATDPSPLGLDLDPAILAQRAVENRMEMLELELQLSIDADAVDFQRNQALPLFVVDYSYTVNGLGGSYRRAFDQLPEHSFEDWTFGAQVEIPLGNEAAESRISRAILQRLQRLATREQRALSIRQEVFNALDQLQQNWQRILAARQESVLAGRTFAAEQRQFDLGLRTSTDVLDAATRLSDAQSREISALADYQIALVDLAFATGTVLGEGKIDWMSDVRVE